MHKLLIIFGLIVISSCVTAPKSNDKRETASEGGESIDGNAQTQGRRIYVRDESKGYEYNSVVGWHSNAGTFLAIPQSFWVRDNCNFFFKTRYKDTQGESKEFDDRGECDWVISGVRSEFKKGSKIVKATELICEEVRGYTKPGVDQLKTSLTCKAEFEVEDATGYINRYIHKRFFTFEYPGKTLDLLTFGLSIKLTELANNKEIEQLHKDVIQKYNEFVDIFSKK